MEFCSIFETANESECRLWAVIYPGHEISIFDVCYDNWTNDVFVRSFVKERFDSLDSVFFKRATVLAIKNAIALEVEKFTDELLKANYGVVGC